MASVRRHRQRRPARGPATRSPRRRLLVVCEGAKTEPDYVRGFVRQCRAAVVEIRIPDERGDPRRLVEIAKKHKTWADREARSERDPLLAYDEVWCVFDRDQHERFTDACTMARDNGFLLAVSNPCFELWLLLHFRDSPGLQDRHAVQRMVASYIPGYVKSLDFSTVAKGVGDAKRRAERLDADAEAMDEPGRNPTTWVYRLTDSIARTGEETP